MTDVTALTDLLTTYTNRARSCGSDPAAALELAAQLARDAQRVRDQLAVAAAADGGMSYAELGRRLGITRQAAHDAYARQVQQARSQRVSMEHAGTCQARSCTHPAVWCLTSPVEYEGLEHWDMCGWHRPQAERVIKTKVGLHMPVAARILADHPDEIARIRMEEWAAGRLP